MMHIYMHTFESMPFIYLFHCNITTKGKSLNYLLVIADVGGLK
jgi:hypothetical protein